MNGFAYAKHRHDTYAVSLTDRGLQSFDYRGASWTSAPGEVAILHPDEAHDGRAGSEEGFGYRIIYVAPSDVAEAARAICGRSVALPFVATPVLASAILAQAIGTAFLSFPAPIEPLAADALIEILTRGLLVAAPPVRSRRWESCDRAALARVREYLDAGKTRVVGSAELEVISGHDRFSLARQFRRIHGTSPYRYLLMRRLEHARAGILAGRALAQVAFDCGFADQAHMTRLFKTAYGLSPARLRAVAASR